MNTFISGRNPYTYKYALKIEVKKINKKVKYINTFSYTDCFVLQVLSPRNDVGMYHCGKNKKKKYRDGEKDKENGGGEGKLEEQRDPSAIVS